MTFLYALIFAGSSILLAIAGDWLVRSLVRIARFFGWQEFIAAFFIMSVAVSVPEFFIGITAALKGIPELSFGNIIGANIIHFSLAIALATLVMGKLPFETHNIRVSADFTILFALLPFLLLIDNTLSRIDGIILMVSFFIYVIWIFSKRERFSEYYKTEVFNGTSQHGSPFQQFRHVMKDIGVFILGMTLLLASAQGIVISASFFAEKLGIPLVLMGIFVVGLGTALPETYFAVASARRGNSKMVVGNLLGSTAITASFVLGLVAVIQPIVIHDFSPYVLARLFLIVSAVAFLVFARTGKVISSREAQILLLLYVLFIFTQLLFA